jgi:transcriptional regulator GlxA family with amidase domain
MTDASAATPPLPRVAVLAFEGISPFHLSVPTLVFGAAGLDSADPLYDVLVCAEQPGSLMTGAGYRISVDAGLEAFEQADMIVLPSWREGREASAELLAAVRAAHARGARVVGLCLGGFVVAASGIADGRELVTHWAAADRLAAGHPNVLVRRDVLWLDHGDVITSAGVAAALDCCLHLARLDHGSAAATRLARALVLAPHRSGSQAQYIPVPIAHPSGDDPIERAMAWARSRLGEPLELDDWAAAVHLSRRTFTRRFRERTASSPQQWLLAQRLDHARLLLESGELPVEQVAVQSGFGSAVTLRHHFHRRLGLSPAAHRAEFRGRAAVTAPSGAA